MLNLRLYARFRRWGHLMKHSVLVMWRGVENHPVHRGVDLKPWGDDRGRIFCDCGREF